MLFAVFCPFLRYLMIFIHRSQQDRIIDLGRCHMDHQVDRCDPALS